MTGGNKEVIVDVNTTLGIVPIKGQGRVIRIEFDESLWVELKNQNFELRVPRGHYQPDLPQIQKLIER